MSEKLDQFIERLEVFFPKPLSESDWHNAKAFRWQRRQSLLGNIGFLKPIWHLSNIRFDDLQAIDRQKGLIVNNTQHFVAGKPANNVLLTGARWHLVSFLTHQGLLESILS
jgi:predicted AAA+ superfamily ATPase